MFEEVGIHFQLIFDVLMCQVIGVGVGFVTGFGSKFGILGVCDVIQEQCHCLDYVHHSFRNPFACCPFGGGSCH